MGFLRAAFARTNATTLGAAVAALHAVSGCVEKAAIAVEDPCAGGACAVGAGGADAGSGGAETGGAETGGAAATGGVASGGAGTGGSSTGGGGSTGGASGTGGAQNPDSGAPLPLYTLILDAPEDQSTVSGVVTVRGRATGFVNVEVWDSTHQNPALAQTSPVNGAFSTTIDVSGLPEGPTRWTVNAWDSAPGQSFEHTASRVLRLTVEHDAVTCDGQTCSGHGACSVVNGAARCACETGYEASGLSCVPSTVGTCAARTGAAGHVAPTCVRKALFGGAHLDVDAYAQKLGRERLDLAAQWDDVLAAPQGQTAEQDWGWVAGHFSTDQWIVRAQWPGALALGMPMWMRGQSPQICASGANDANMRRAITTLKAMIGPRDVYIRLGWKFNAEWYPTQESEGDAAYQKAWRDCWVRWYDIVKDVDPTYMLVWNPIWANQGRCESGYTSVLGLWPGKEFVDAAGPDQYDANWCGRPATAGEMDGEQPIGIGAWADWVIGQGVPFAVPEWGVDNSATGSGDRAQFIRDVYAALKKAHAAPSGIAFQTYFDGGATYSCTHSLLDPACKRNPLASAAFFDAFRVWPPQQD